MSKRFREIQGTFRRGAGSGLFERRDGMLHTDDRRQVSLSIAAPAARMQAGSIA
jgi:hypothetical protein